jgi:hypothetical protein
MATYSKLGAVSYETESSWGENVATYGTRLAVLAAVDLSGFKQDKIVPDRVVQYRNDDTAHIIGPMDGTFKVKLFLAGHGAATSGATAMTALGTLLANVFGAGAVSAASGTTTSGGTAAVPTTVASGTFSAGSLCRIGTGGIASDARGAGQFLAIGTHVTTTLTLLTAAPGAPNAADVLHSAETIYADDSAAVTSSRWRIQSAGLQIEAHGCFPTDVTIGDITPGAVPFVEVTFRASWWKFVAATFPSATSVDAFNPAPVGAGSLFMAVKGTATRATRTIRDISINYKLGIAPQMGVNGVNEYQTICGAIRTGDDIRVNITEDADAATTTPVLAGFWDGTSEYHMLYTLNPTAGQAVGMYFPAMRVVGSRPTQMDKDGVNSVSVELKANTNIATATNALTLSAFRLGLA